MKNKICLDTLSKSDALPKSDARWDGKQEIFYIWPNSSNLDNILQNDSLLLEIVQIKLVYR